MARLKPRPTKLRHALGRLLPPPVLFRVNNDKPAFASGEQVPCLVSNLPFMIQLTAIAARHKSLDYNFLPCADRTLKFHAKVRRDGALSVETRRLAHDFIEEQCNDPAVKKPGASLVFFAQPEAPHDTLAGVILFERQMQATRVRPATSEAPVVRLRIKSHLAPYTSCLLDQRDARHIRAARTALALTHLKTKHFI
jgi:hypothetical protein